MAKSSCAWLSLSLSFLLLFNGCFGRHSSELSPDECLLHQIQPLDQPSIRIQAEAGVTEFWDPNNEQFLCGGSHFLRHTIQPGGLLLPSYTNAPLLAYVLQGSGEFGLVVPGCPETYQSFEPSDQDRHQKIGQYNKGDIIVFPEGLVHWVYNNRKEDTILVVMQDSSNDHNQQDAYALRYFLAGSSQQQQGRQRQPGQQSGGQQDPSPELLGFNSNILSPLGVQIVKDALNTDTETAQKIVESEQKGHIINVGLDLELISPTSSSEQPHQSRRQQGQGGRGGGSSNGLEETLCTARVRQNINNPDRPDIYNPEAGRLTALNSLTLPALGLVRLSAAHGFLNQNHGIVPRWCMNAHTFIYATQGRARVTIVNQQAEAILDQEVQEGQLFLVPQNFAVVIQTGAQNVFEWVEFNTNDNAMFNTLSGRTSTLAGLPADIIAASYDISTSKAQSLKKNMKNVWFYKVSDSSPSSSSPSGRYAFI